MHHVTSRWPHQHSIKVEWNIGKRCNYDCTYCPSYIHDNTSPHTDIEVLKSTIDKLVALKKPVRLSFTGGEPTVHPHIEELLTHAHRAGVDWINLTTNGTRPWKWYANNENLYDHIVFSLHFEHNWVRALDTITTLKLNCHVPIMVHIMAHHDYMAKVRIAQQQLNDFMIPYAIRRIRWTEEDHNIFDDMRYNLNDLEWILEQTATVAPNCRIDPGTPGEQLLHANDIIKLHLNKYKSWSCNAGLESLMINWDGEVHRATCRVGGSLGNIYTGTFTVPTEPIVCTRDNCTCAADIPITKVNLEQLHQNLSAGSSQSTD